MSAIGLRAVTSQPAPAREGEYVCEWYATHHRIASPVRRHLTTKWDHCDTLVDIGAGDGTVLDDIASRFPQLRRVMGISADPRSLCLARKRCSNDRRMDFAQTDPWSWLRSSGGQRLMVFSYDNLSVLSERTLEQWFAELPNLGVTALALVEPQTGGCSELPQMLGREGWQLGHCETAVSRAQAWWHVVASRFVAPTQLGELP